MEQKLWLCFWSVVTTETQRNCHTEWQDSWMLGAADYSRRWVCSLLHVYGVTSYIYPLIIKNTILIPLILTSLSCFVSNNFPVHIPIRLEASTMSLFPPQQIGGTCSFPIYLLVKYSCIFLWLRGRAPFSEKVDSRT